MSRAKRDQIAGTVRSEATDLVFDNFYFKSTLNCRFAVAATSKADQDIREAVMYGTGRSVCKLENGLCNPSTN